MRSITRAARFCVFLSTALVGAAGAADSLQTTDPTGVSIGHWSTVRTESGVPEILRHPEGRTRWELDRVALEGAFERSIAVSTDGRWTTTEIGIDAAGQTPPRTMVWARGAERWLLPHLDPDLTSPTPRALALERDGESLTVAVRRVGVGWVLLPGGPREVVLQRVVSRPADGLGRRTIEHRWVDPREGVVARVWGPATPDGRARARVEGAEILTRSVVRGPALKIYSDEVLAPVFTRINYGLDLGEGVAIDDMVPDTVTTIQDLVDLGSWDFSGNTIADAVGEWASTVVPIAGETCSEDQCGFTTEGAVLSREDKNFGTVDLLPTVTAVEKMENASDVTIWLRAAVRNEGISGAFGSGESRICYTENGRTEVPLWRFGNQDADGFFMQVGDSWTSGVFDCEQNIFNQLCPNNCGLFCPLYSSSCPGFEGTQRGQVLADGPVTLPSGHTFQSQVVLSVAEFCVYLFSSCGSPVDTVRTTIYLWQVPGLGTVTRLQSVQRAEPDEFSWTTTGETDIKYGLFPPLSVQTDAVTDTTLAISWDPGLDTRQIDGYKVYWDTDSGGASDYAFNSVDQPGQVSINGTTATISGLTPGTEYFVTVTSLSDYLDPATSVTTRYESALFPTTFPAAPNPLPVELTATTTGGACTPTEEVLGVTVDKISGTEWEICWNAVADTCPTGYDVLGAPAPDAFGNFSVLAQPGLVTCQTVQGSDSYFLIGSRGPGGVGPLGHYGR